MAFADEDPRYNRYSFLTKFITYLAAGLPVITLGHPESSVMQMAREYRVGLTSITSEVATLSSELRVALANPNLWESYGTEIQRCATTEFDASRMRSILYGCFQQCADATNLTERR